MANYADDPYGGYGTAADQEVYHDVNSMTRPSHPPMQNMGPIAMWRDWYDKAPNREASKTAFIFILNSLVLLVCGAYAIWFAQTEGKDGLGVESVFGIITLIVSSILFLGIVHVFFWQNYNSGGVTSRAAKSVRRAYQWVKGPPKPRTRRGAVLALPPYNFRRGKFTIPVDDDIPPPPLEDAELDLLDVVHIRRDGRNEPRDPPIRMPPANRAQLYNRSDGVMIDDADDNADERKFQD